MVPGLHEITLDGLRQMCHLDFPLSKTRESILNGLVDFLVKLRAAAITSGEVWIDGSFLTRKIDPQDVDFVVCVDADVYDNGTVEQKAFMDSIANDDWKSPNFCDCYLSLAWPAGHALHNEGELNREYWKKQFGTSRNGDPKGMAVIRLEALTI